MPWLKSTSQNLTTIGKGFPAELQALTANVSKKHIKQHENYPIKTAVFCLETNEEVLVPSRIHTDSYASTDLSGTEKLIYDCIYSRSTDGYSREKALRSLYAAKSLPLPFWTIPYLYLSLSDYVIEISSIVKPDDEDIVNAFQKLSSLNPEQYRLTKARATSYWNEYYKKDSISGYRGYASKHEYPAIKVIDRINR